MEVSWSVELAVKPGQLANFASLTGEMVAATQDEAGVLAYQRFVDPDKSLVYVYERYADSAAAIAHLLKFGERFGRRFSRLVERRRFLVFGCPNDQLKILLDPYGAIYLKPFGPFTYWA